MTFRRFAAAFAALLALLAVGFWLLQSTPVANAGDIHEAARANDLDAIKQLLKTNDKSISSRDEDRRQPLHLASRFGDADTVAYLLSHGADVNARCYNDFTPLHLTSDPKIAKLLLEAGADLKAEAATGTPMQDAVSDQNYAIVEVLLAAGAKLDLESLIKMGRTEDVAAALSEKPWLAKAPRKLLHTACWSGRYDIAKLLLEAGADPNQDYGFSNVFGVYSPFSAAVTGNHYEVAELLCNYDVDMRVSGGKMYDSLFHYAVAAQDKRYVTLMLKHGASVHASNHWGGLTPLHVAVSINDAEKVGILLQHGANPNAATPDGATPLTFAAFSDNRKIADALIAAGGKKDLYIASALGDLDFVKQRIAAKADQVNQPDTRMRRTPLFWAIAGGKRELATWLLDNGAEVNALAPEAQGNSVNLVTGPGADDEGKLTDGETPLHAAAQRGDAALAKLLLDRGAKVNAVYIEQGVTPLDLAVHARRLEVVEALLARGADVNGSRRSNSYPPLATAIDDAEMLQLLLDHKPSQRSMTEALASAVRSEDFEAARKLLDAGAKPDFHAACQLGLIDQVKQALAIRKTAANKAALVNRRQRAYPSELPINLAARSGRLDVVKLLIETGAKWKGVDKDDDGAAAAAAQGGSIAVLRHLIQLGADVNRKDGMGRTPLFAAASGGHVDAIALLLDHNAELLAHDVYRNTALHAAASGGHVESLRLLLDRGAAVDHRNEYGDTALYAAAFAGKTEAARLLLDKGANVNARNHRRETPLFAAENRDRTFDLDKTDRKPVADLLRKRGGVK